MTKILVNSTSILASNLRLAMEKIVKNNSGSVFHYSLGFDVESFFYLCKKISPSFEDYSLFLDNYVTLKRSNKGKKILIRVEDCVALFLAWTRTRVSMFVLQIKFCKTQSNISLYIWFGHCLFVNSFNNAYFAKIAFLNEVQIMEYVREIKT